MVTLRGVLQRQTSTNGVVFYFSPLLAATGVPHGFSTRIGGDSPPPFDSLNLGNPNGCEIQDDYDRIWANYERLQEAVGCAGRPLVRVHQVHGGKVVAVQAGEEFDVATEADALVTRDPARTLSVRIADCAPVLLASGDGRTVAAVHAGWRGVIAGVVIEAIQAMRLLNVDTGAESIIAAIGPCIGFDAFEVGPEVLEEFTKVFGHSAPISRRPDGKGTVDLREAIRSQLLAAGVGPASIDTTDRCTFRDRDEFFSHRRDNGVTGRMAAVIGTAR
jgi:YfiH family protein